MLRSALVNKQERFRRSERSGKQEGGRKREHQQRKQKQKYRHRIESNGETCKMQKERKKNNKIICVCCFCCFALGKFNLLSVCLPACLPVCSPVKLITNYLHCNACSNNSKALHKRALRAIRCSCLQCMYVKTSCMATS